MGHFIKGNGRMANVRVLVAMCTGAPNTYNRQRWIGMAVTGALIWDNFTMITTLAMASFTTVIADEQYS